MGPESAYSGGGSTVDLSGIETLVHTGNAQLDLAQHYALTTIGADYNGTAHVAAVNYYVNPWVRDSFAWGMVPSQRDISIGAYATTELAFWLQRQQPFGGWLTAPKSGYFDETPILIGAVLDAYDVTGDLHVVTVALPELERGWAWLRRGFIQPDHGSSVLIYANVPPHVAADWADQVGRTGYATQLEALWFHATTSLATMEALTGHLGRSRYYRNFAHSIARDINRLLWTSTAPAAFNAPSVKGFGHYRSWIGPRDYFELDSNMLCILYGIASPRQARSIIRFVLAHDRYLLGVGSGYGVPARVVYGDYARVDYARKHESLGPGKYQSAYWPSVGALVAMALARTGNLSESRRVLEALAAAFVSQGSVHEWYSADGAGHGAPAFGWAARMFLVALYSAYLGIDVIAPTIHFVEQNGLTLGPPAGSGSGTVNYRGRTIQIKVDGMGSVLHYSVSDLAGRGTYVPLARLCEGCSLDAHWQ